jgi:predicted Zn-dependent protease
MQGGSGCGGIRLVIGLVIAAFSACSYYRLSQPNPVTGENQRIDISPQQEVALGLQAAPQMAAQHGGLDPDPRAQQVVDEIGNEIVNNSAARQSQFQFEFHALRDNRTVNAFALPGGQIFITRALLSKLQRKSRLAGVLAHEVAHVVARHSAEQMAKQRFAQGLTGAAVIASTDPGDPRTYKNAAVAAMVGQLVNLKFTRDHEIEADALGVRLMVESGYDPRALIDVMKVLAEAGGGRGGPDFFKTHPNPENRIGNIQREIERQLPNGVPPNMRQ